MTEIIVYPSSVNGTIEVPASKSVVQRALALSILHKGKSLIRNIGNSDDEKVMLSVAGAMALDVSGCGNETLISSNGLINPPSEIHCGESGLALRMLAPIFAASSHEITFTGEGSLLKRSLNSLTEILNKAGVTTSTHNGYLPLNIRGPLKVEDISVDGSAGSQPITGLLFSYAATTNKRVTIILEHSNSRPYIDLSIEMLNHFGYRVINENYQRLIIYPREQIPENMEYNAEGDWSSASFLLVAAAISGKISINNLKKDSSQADTAVVSVLADTGANIYWEDESLICKKDKLRSFHVDATQCPDLFPPLAALAANCDGISEIVGISRLLNKESNRLLSISDVLSGWDIKSWTTDDSLFIQGGSISKSTIDSHGDHRIAMMASIGALNAKGEVQISNPLAINKSYPAFFHDLQSLGVKMNFYE